MLTLYRRHRETCKNSADRYAKRDSCPMWCEGTVEGVYRRQSLKTRSWERAEEIRREIETGKREQAAPLTIADAIRRFLHDAEHGRKLTLATLKKYRVLLSQLSEFSAARGLTEIADADVDFAREFRASWKDGPISSSKKLERFRAFFRFCQSAGWTDANPAASVTPPRVKAPPTLPFSEKEVEAALALASEPRWHALIQVLRWSGLRIGDAVKLSEDRIDGSRLFLYTAKTGTPVYVPLPDFVIAELKALPKYGGHFFWKRAGESKTDTASGNARRSLRKIFKAAKVKNGYPHRFRDSFAVGLLEQGVPLETVSVLLGHASIRVTQKHYAPWVKSLQQHLEKAVASAWPKAKLQRVK